MNRSYLPVFKVITSCGGLALGKTTEEKRVRTGNKLMGQSKGNCLSITIISKTSFTREKITDCQSKLKCNYWFRLREIKEETLKVPLVHFIPFFSFIPCSSACMPHPHPVPAASLGEGAAANLYQLTSRTTFSSQLFLAPTWMLQRLQEHLLWCHGPPPPPCNVGFHSISALS